MVSCRIERPGIMTTSRSSLLACILLLFGGQVLIGDIGIASASETTTDFFRQVPTDNQLLFEQQPRHIPELLPGQPPMQPASREYVLGAGDRLRINVFRLPEYSGDYEVLVDGTVNLPMLRPIVLEGLTLDQAEAAVSRAYGERIRRPIIDLTLVEPRPLRIGIAGEVARPGSYMLTREGTQFPSLVNALEAAGGIMQSADLRQVRIQRTNAGGGQQTIRVDLWQFLQTGDLRYNQPLRDGDTIVVPTREQFDPTEALQLAAASFASDDNRPLNVAVVGEVFRPGPYTVTGSARTGQAGVPGGSDGSPTPPTVTRAIQVAGGIKPEANIRDIEVHRRTRGGEKQVIRINLWQLLRAGELTEDIVLQEGDTIYVPLATNIPSEEIAEISAASFSPNSIRVNIVGEVGRPGVIEVPPNIPLSQGVLAAGGFNNRANASTVDLIRLNPDGTATRTTFSIDFAEGLNPETNPSLRNNDIIVVGRSASASFADTLDTLITPLGRALSLFTIPANILNLF